MRIFILTISIAIKNNHFKKHVISQLHVAQFACGKRHTSLPVQEWFMFQIFVISTSAFKHAQGSIQFSNCILTSRVFFAPRMRHTTPPIQKTVLSVSSPFLQCLVDVSSHCSHSRVIVLCLGCKLRVQRDSARWRNFISCPVSPCLVPAGKCFLGTSNNERRTNHEITPNVPRPSRKLSEENLC